jgi:dihydroorotase
MVKTGLLTWSQLAERMSISPARIAGYTEHGQPIAPGSVANLTVVDPDRKYTVDRSASLSKSKNNPFHGMELHGVVTHVLFAGTLVLDNGIVNARVND